MNKSNEIQTEQTVAPATNDDLSFIESLLADPEVEKELNKDTEAPEKAASDDGAEKQKETVKPRSLAEAAERLGLKVEDLYTLEVPLAGDGSTTTLGKLKDDMVQYKGFEATKLAFEEEKLQFELGSTRAKEELGTIIGKLKGAIPEKHFETLLEAGRREHTAKLNEQKAKVFEYIPEWQNREVLAKDVSEINEFLEPYFGAKAFDQFNNAKMIKLLRDVTKREARVRAAVAKMTEVTGKAAPNASKKSPPKNAPVSRHAKVDPRKAFVDGLFK
jgi:hypothetical protein